MVFLHGEGVGESLPFHFWKRFLETAPESERKISVTSRLSVSWTVLPAGAVPVVEKQQTTVCYKAVSVLDLAVTLHYIHSGCLLTPQLEKGSTT